MNNNLLKIAYRFALDVVNATDKVRAIILFGSVAKGTSRPDSDIDVLIIFNTDEPIDDELTAPVRRIARECEYEEYVDIQIIYTNRLLDGLDPYFVQKALGEGIILYAHPPTLTFQNIPVQPYTLIGFSPETIAEPERQVLFTQLHGSWENGRRKGGLLRQLKGKRIAENVVMVSTARVGHLETLLDRFNVPYSELNAWLCE